MSEDIVERLREAAISARTTERVLCDEAADKIERLLEHIAQQQLDIVTLGQEVGRLRDMLSDVVDAWDWWQVDTYDRSQSVPGDAIEVARAALEQEKKS